MALRDKLLEVAERRAILKHQRAEIDRQIEEVTQEYNELFALIKRGAARRGTSEAEPVERQIQNGGDGSQREGILALLEDGQERHIDQIQEALHEPDRKRMLWTIYNLRKRNLIHSTRRGFWKKTAPASNDDPQLNLG